MSRTFSAQHLKALCFRSLSRLHRCKNFHKQYIWRKKSVSVGFLCKNTVTASSLSSATVTGKNSEQNVFMIGKLLYVCFCAFSPNCMIWIPDERIAPQKYSSRPEVELYQSSQHLWQMVPFTVLLHITLFGLEAAGIPVLCVVQLYTTVGQSTALPKTFLKLEPHLAKNFSPSFFAESSKSYFHSTLLGTEISAFPFATFFVRSSGGNFSLLVSLKCNLW